MSQLELSENMNAVTNKDAGSETHEVPKDAGSEKAPAGPRDSGAPFDDEDADMIVRSSDLVDFRVHKVCLSKASLVFRDMIKLQARGPLSATTYPDTLSPTGLPIVPLLDEPAPAVEMLLRFCYIPLLPPSTTSNSPSTSATTAEKSSILSQMESGALPADRVFAFAWLYRQRDLVLAAASHPAREPLLAGPPYPEYELIPALALHKLLAFRRHLRALAATCAPSGDFS
ncbi:hypothetical protein B0H16DRAFT_1739315 [Mycena metata]|uniref:BTB domain-containing protein n=1 Tax=Mycena metata TaxID=1033252 RepID=A0AAD7MJP4_9AGAR|nr:hypothetical protein B0H16DRAFT_1739315 [Mycena metata]